MEKLLKLSFIFLLLGLLACKDNFKPDFTGGKAIALKNGEEWTGQGRGAVNNQGLEVGIDMYYNVFDKIGQLRQSLVFISVPVESGEYNLFETSGQSTDSLSRCNFYTLSFDGDVLEDIYIVVESESTITVDDYTDCNRLLTGSFGVKLYIDPNQPKMNSANPDTLIFESGTFEVTIEE